MSDLKHAELMLTKAQTDLRALRAMADVEEFADEIFGFHAQQAVEKALKAWLSLLGVRYPRVHDLDALLDLLEEAGADVEHIRGLSQLSAFAVELRYDHVSDSPGGCDRPKMVEQVGQLVGLVGSLVADAS